MLVHAYYKRDPRVKKEAEALVEHGHEVDIICLNEGDEPDSEVVNGVSVIRSPISRSAKRRKSDFVREYLSFFIFAWWNLAKLHVKRKYAVAIVHNMPNFLVFATFPWRFFGLRVFLDMHDPAPEYYEYLFSVHSGPIARLVRLEERISARYANALMTVHEPLADMLKVRTLKKPEVFHNFPNLTDIGSARDYLTGDGPFKLVFYGMLKQRYGLDRMVQALRVLNKSEIRFTLDVFGYGPFQADLEQMIKDTDSKDYWHFHGAYESGSIEAHVADKHAALALYHPSEFADLLLPAKVLESIAMGIPVVCVDLETVRSYFDDECLWIFRDDEELIGILEDLRTNYSEAMRRANNGWNRVAQLSWAKEKERYVEFIEAAVQR